MDESTCRARREIDLRLTLTGDAEINGTLTGEVQVFVDAKGDLDEAPPLLEWD